MNLAASSRIGGTNYPARNQQQHQQQQQQQQQQRNNNNTNGQQPIPLPRDSKEYAQVLYQLELGLANHSVKVTHVQVWDISQPNIVEKFERETQRTPGVVPLDTWVDVDGLDSSNSEENIFMRGFTFPDNNDQGMLFSTGGIRIAPPTQEGVESGLHRFIFGQMFTGRAYPKDDPNEKNIVPPGYDSLYLFDSQTLEEDRMFDSYSHEYILMRSTQIWPQYVVHFTVATLTDEDRARQGRAKAAHHNQSTDVMDDILELLDRKLHWGQDGVRMKLSGVAALQNELSRASDEYNNAMIMSQRRDATLEAVKGQIKEQLSALNEKLTQVKKNSALVEETVYQMLQEALFQLQDETQRKLNMLLGEELELRRRFAHIEWAEARLERNRNDMAPPDFIHSWSNHQQLRKRMYSYRDMSSSVLNDVQPDLNVVGGVQIVVENRTDLGQLSSTRAGRNSRAVDSTMKGLDASSEFRKAVFNSAAHATVQTGNRNNGTIASTGLMSNISNANKESNSANNLVSSMRRAMQDGTKPYGGQGVSSAPSPTIAGMGLSSASLASQDTRSYLRNRGDVVDAYGNTTSASDNTNQNAGMDNVWMSTLRGQSGNTVVQNQPQNTYNNNNSNNSNNNYFGTDNTPKETKNELPVTPKQNIPTPTKRSGGNKSGGKLDRLRRTYSISVEAKRRKRVIDSKLPGLLDDDERFESLMFKDSELLDREQARDLYFCIPMRDSNNVNDCSSLVYSSKDHHLSVSAIHQALDDARHNGDEYGIVLIGKSGSHVFGAYSHFIPPNDNTYHGSNRNFLFSTTKDLKVPYSGRNRTNPPTVEIYKDIIRKRKELERQQYGDEGDDQEEVFVEDWEAQGALNELLQQRGWDSLFGSEDTIFFGASDLVLKSDLTMCTSSLEHAYGIGLSHVDSKSLLAGSDTFRLHQLEIYIVTSSDNEYHHDIPLPPMQ